MDRKPHLLHAELGDEGCLFGWRIECPYTAAERASGDLIACYNPAYPATPCLAVDYVSEIGGEILTGFERRIGTHENRLSKAKWVGTKDPHFPIHVDLEWDGDELQLTPWTGEPPARLKPTTVAELDALLAEFMPWASIEAVDRHSDEPDDGEFVIYTGLRLARIKDERFGTVPVDFVPEAPLEDFTAEGTPSA